MPDPQYHASRGLSTYGELLESSLMAWFEHNAKHFFPPVLQQEDVLESSKRGYQSL